MSNQFTASSEVTSDDKLWALLSYIINLIFPIIILVSDEKKNRPFLKYHAVQALALYVIIIVVGTITFGCVAVLGVAYSIYIGIKAYQGEYVVIPVVTDFCKKQGWIK
jgi:uncharacterized protein